MKTKEDLIKVVMNSNIDEDSKIELILMISKETVHILYTIYWYPISDRPWLAPFTTGDVIYDSSTTTFATGISEHCSIIIY